MLLTTMTGCGGGSDGPEEPAAVTVAVGRMPTAVAVGHDSVWVANYGGSVRKPAATPATTGENGETIPGTVPAESADSGTVLRIDPATNKVTAKIIVNKGPCVITVAESGVYVSNCRDGTVSRIDPDTNAVTATFPGIATAVADGSVWTTDASSLVLRLDPVSGARIAEIPTGSQPAALTAREGSVWVSNLGNGTISRIDTAANTVAATASAPKAGSLALVADTLWSKSSGEPTTVIIPYEPQTLEPGEPLTIDSATSDFAVGAGALWVRTSTPSLLRIDPGASRVVKDYELRFAIGGLAVGFGSVWVGNYEGNSVTRIPLELLAPEPS